MTKRTLMKKFEPGHGFTREDWDAVDSPELTDDEIARLQPASEVLPQAFFDAMDREAEKRRGRPATDNPKKQVTLRLDADIVERYKSTGRGWQSRINADLRKSIGL